MDFTIPQLDITKKVDRNFYHPHQVTEYLNKNGYVHLGWLNGGIKTPDIPFQEIYSNCSGSYCIYVNHEAQLYYCVDMGD
jgi:hypothetical protein